MLVIKGGGDDVNVFKWDDEYVQICYAMLVRKSKNNFIDNWENLFNVCNLTYF